MATKTKVKDQVEDVNIDDLMEEDGELFSVPTSIDPDTYLVECTNIYKKEWEGENKFKPGKPNESIMWVLGFNSIDDDGNISPLIDENTGEQLVWEFSTSTSISDRSTAFKYASCFLRRPPKREEFISLRKLLRGKKAIVVIGQKDNGYPKIMDMAPHIGGK